MITYRALKPDSHGVQAGPVKEVELKMFLMTLTTQVTQLESLLMLATKREKELPEETQQGNFNTLIRIDSTNFSPEIPHCIQRRHGRHG